MKKNFALLLILFPIVVFCQREPPITDGKVFNSVFQDLRSGQFPGTVNGLIILKYNNQKTILDFQGSLVELEIELDSFEVYDVSTKIYKGKTSSGKTNIEYRTYGSANAIRVFISDNWYELSYIDGSCYGVIDGIEYQYEAEKATEYLVLNVTKELTLNNWQHIIQTEYITDPDNIQELKPKRKEIKMLPNSTIVFAIKRE